MIDIQPGDILKVRNDYFILVTMVEKESGAIFGIIQGQKKEKRVGYQEYIIKFINNKMWTYIPVIKDG